FIVLAVAYFGYVLWIDTRGTAAVFTRFTKPIGWQDLVAARLATYPVSVVNYGMGQATFAYYLHRKRRIPIPDVLGVFFLILMADIGWAIFLAFVGSLLHDYQIAGVAIRPFVRIIAGVAVVAMCLHLGFWRLGRLRLIARLPGWSRLLAWLETKHLVRIFREATLFDYARLALWRLPIHAMFPLTFYAIALLFHTHVPFWQLLGAVPIVILIGTIPITPGGLGTTNAAFVEMLRGSIATPPLEQGAVTTQELILAMTLLWMFANYFQKALFGGIFLARMGKDLRHPPVPAVTTHPPL
ncbi:MAG: flippase-like domain-containing protein, partial [Deltaproteobacteria bacterium]|nr:flippase-like domain-containing protein [Deltaproteobacteria bacterium]